MHEHDLTPSFESRLQCRPCQALKPQAAPSDQRVLQRISRSVPRGSECQVPGSCHTLIERNFGEGPVFVPSHKLT
jgi:hypothetical protein